MKLNNVVDRYVQFKRSLGMRFHSQSMTLAAFRRAMGDIDIRQVRPRQVSDFLLCNGRVSSGWHCKRATLAGFYRFVLGRGYATRSPLPTTIPRRPGLKAPYIFTTRELQQLVDSTSLLAGPRSPFHRRSFRTLLLTLYGAGLRIGEAVRLTLADIDLERGLLMIRESKFYKTRLVPIGPRLTAVLGNYLRERRHLLTCPMGRRSAVFPTRRGTAMTAGYAEWLFRKLRGGIGLRSGGPARLGPRLHDIRHTAAVHRLVAWYKQGADVQRLLPQLSVYLGHANIKGTQRYLEMTPELLKQASRRFERYARLEVSHEQ